MPGLDLPKRRMRLRGGAERFGGLRLPAGQIPLPSCW